MGLNNAIPARDDGYQNVIFLRKNFVFGDSGSVLTVGTVPAGAIILKPLSGVNVETAFNAGTNNFLDVGTSANDDLYATDLALGTLGFVPLDENVSYKVTADTTIIATPALSGTAATTGAGTVVIAFIPDN